MSLSDDLERIAVAAAALSAPGEQMTGVLAAEPDGAGRIYLCAFESAGRQAWLALDGDAQPVESRRRVHEAASLAALCEVAEELAGGGNLTELRARLAELRATEAPDGIEEAEAAAAALQSTLQPEPRLATPAYLDALGAASRRLERALSDDAGSPFAVAMQQALPAIEELAAQIEARYKLPLS
ncbi:MAG TPA: hypothetical protein VMS63_01180 [Gaiellaceae bacterium]|nr:hypothetical protein [Gaiellaceae bacterium]